jgi:hypothetical protein
MKTLTLQVPDDLYEALAETGTKSGGSLEEVALRWLAQRSPKLRGVSVDDKGRERRGVVTRYFGAWDSGDPNSADNERIDADLAREYASNHEGQA